MIDGTHFNLLAVPYSLQALMTACAVLVFGFVVLLVRVARLNRNIVVLATRVTALESRQCQPAPLSPSTAPLPKTNPAHDGSQPNATDASIPAFSADSMIETAILMIKAGDPADQIRFKLGIEPELLAILIQQHKTA